MVAYVALLRGIAPANPKMRNTELRRVVSSVGLDDVRTVISSGNVTFTSGERRRSILEARIEAALADHLGAPCRTIVRSRSQIDGLLASDVFDGFDDRPSARLNVTFLKARPSVAVPDTPEGSEIVAVRRQAVFSVIDTTRAKDPSLMAAIEKAYGPAITTRTWRTVGRIAAAFDA